jgi:hypothetical protein
LANWRFYSPSKKQEDKPFFTLPITAYQNAAIGFEGTIESTQSQEYSPLIYELFAKKITKHIVHYQQTAYIPWGKVGEE